MEPPQREPKTYMAYKYCLELFASHCAKRFIQDVKREDLLAFIRKLYELNCGPRTAYNRAVIVSQLLKANGISKLLHNRDWPEYVEPIRPMYEEEEIQTLLKACDEKERVLYLCYLLTGLRDKEMRYLTWRDIDFRTQVIRVTRKPLCGFKPKNKEEREVPVPASLITALKKYKGSKKLNAECPGFPERIRQARQAPRVQIETHRVPRENELRAVHFETWQQMLGGTLLLEFLPAQIPTHVRDAKFAGSRLRYQDPAELDGAQRPGVNDGLSEGGSEQRCLAARQFERTGSFSGLRPQSLVETRRTY